MNAQDTYSDIMEFLAAPSPEDLQTKFDLQEERDYYAPKGIRIGNG